MSVSDKVHNEAYQPELSKVLKSVKYAQRVIAGIEKRRNGKPLRDQILNEIAEKERAKTLAKIESDIAQALYKIDTLKHGSNGLLCERVIMVDELSTFVEKVNEIKKGMLRSV